MSMSKFGTKSRKRTTETLKGHANGFAKGGRSKPAQFSEKTPGQREVGFRQKTASQATAAMQGSSPPARNTKADAGPRRDAKRQFGQPSGRKVF